MGHNRESLSVALLVADISNAKKLGQVFRELGVLPHVYDDLGEFWSGVLESAPTIAIVDVRMMSEGTLLLKNHPLIKSGELPLSFLFSERTKPLLNSTYTIFNMGLINIDLAISGQIKSVLRRVNRINHLENMLGEQRKKLEKSDAKLERLMGSSGELMEREHYFNRSRELAAKVVELTGKESSMVALCGRFFDEMEEVVEYTILQLNRTGQKLISPRLQGDKFMVVPSLWLGESYKQGIELLGQNMASQVVSDLMDGEIISLSVTGQDSFPEMLIYLRTGSISFMNLFDWEGLESQLVGANRYYVLNQKDDEKSEERIITPWHGMTLLDRYSVSIGEGEWNQEQLSHLSLDLGQLVRMVKSGQGGCFHWSDFFTDLLKRLDKQGEFDYRVSCSGVSQISFFISGEEKDTFQKVLSRIVKEFSYWRYFENGEQLLTNKIKLPLQTLPLTAHAYLRYLEKMDSVEETIISQKQPAPLKNRVNVAPL